VLPLLEFWSILLGALSSNFQPNKGGEADISRLVMVPENPDFYQVTQVYTAEYKSTITASQDGF
jgi:hypothetical protein